MRATLFSLGLSLLLTTGRAAAPQNPDLAAYDTLLASVAPGQTTVAMGDMLVPVSTVQLWRDQLAGSSSGFATQTGINKWTGGIVYYTFNANVSAAHQKAVLDAMAEWTAFANLSFVARTSQTNYIKINDVVGLSGGNSALGMIGGEQQLNIGSNSWARGTLLHELGHALGLIHEHQRSDRNTYVTIQTANLSGGAANPDFALVPSSLNTGVYDFLSVMHYTRDAFSTNPPADTIVPTASYTQFINVMGRSPDRILSRADRDGIAALYGAPVVATSTVVTNTKDAGAGTLRTALYKAFDLVTDTPSTTPTVFFQIPNTDPNFTGGVFTIQLSAKLPTPGAKTIIDGTTQVTLTGNTNVNGPEIVLNGALLTEPANSSPGLRLSQANGVVKDLIIQQFPQQGILITGTSATGNTVSGCYIGTNPAGTGAVANTFSGIEINSGATGNIVGGTVVTARNVISGNAAQGVFLRGAGTTGNFVQGNYLGLNAAGTGALPNAFSGVEIGDSAGGNTVGGIIAGAGNVLSGNTFQGIYISGTSSNTIAGNFIGTDAAGAAALANGAAGIEVSAGSQTNLIGGNTTAARNVLSGNTYQGVLIHGTNANGNIVAGNYVGLNAAGTAALANAGGGIGLYSAASNNTVGGTAAGAGNIISGNVAQGVAISGVGTSGNVVHGNFIGTNPAGTSAIPNTYSGVGIFSGATSNSVGGSVAGSLNLISGNANQGVLIYNAGTNSNLIQGNWIGLNAAGTAALANGYSGIQIGNGAKNNQVGGTTVAARNVISGNTYQGVAISDSGTTGNAVSGNYIGTNAAGTAALSNGFPGVEIYGGATTNTIGGAAAAAGNVISGNRYRQITLTDAATSNNVIASNLIGLNAAGTAALPSPLNPGPGIQLFGGAHDNTIGGTSGGRNFISGNPASGLTLSGVGTNANIIVGNSIGTTPAGAVVANSSEGIALFADVTGGPQGNVIGGTAPGAANFISGNTGPGIGIYNSTSLGNRISGNSIVANGGRGIDLGGDGVTANDAGDGDSGPANLQNYPVLTSAVLGTVTTIGGSLNSAVSTVFRIEFFANVTADGSNYGEGQNFLGAINVATDTGGNATISAALNAVVPAGQRVCAVAIDPAGNTSEFSQNVVVTMTDSDTDGLPDSYETANWPLITTTSGSVDSDGDGFTNAQELRAGTNPRNSTSLPLLGNPVVVGGDRTLSLPTLVGRTYRLEYTDNLLTSWRVLADQIAGSGSSIVLTDPGAASITQRFYRAVVVP